MNPFQYLFYCSETIPEGLGFSWFSIGHLIWLAAIVLINAMVCVRYRRSDKDRRLRIRRVVSALLIADELLKVGVLSATGCYTAEYLPLHLCSINIFVCLWYTLYPNAVAGDILYALSLSGAIVSLCVPTWVKLPYLNLMSFHSFSVHGLLMLYPLLLITSGEHSPRFRRMWVPVAFLLVLGPGIYWFNCRWNTNFMFLNGTADNAVLEAVYRMTGDTYYIPGLGLLVLLIIAAMYLPWGIRDMRVRAEKQ